MKRLGLLGGMSWQSTALYYSLLNEAVHKALGGVHSCDLYLHSFDFQKIKDLQIANDWSELNKVLSESAKALKAAGCEKLLICTNTMHKCAEYVLEDAGIEIIHIVDAISKEIHQHQFSNVGFMGTKYAMEEDFLHSRYRANQINTIIPNEADRDEIHRIIFDELVNGIIRENSRKKLIEISNRLFEKGAQGLIAGCTEIELILRQSDLDIPLFESTKLHCKMAIAEIL